MTYVGTVLVWSEDTQHIPCVCEAMARKTMHILVSYFFNSLSLTVNQERSVVANMLTWVMIKSILWPCERFDSNTIISPNASFDSAKSRLVIFPSIHIDFISFADLLSLTLTWLHYKFRILVLKILYIHTYVFKNLKTNYIVYLHYTHHPYNTFISKVNSTLLSVEEFYQILKFK